jgi:hypothetical protein
MATITFEIENPHDFKLMTDLAVRLGLKIKKNKNGKSADSSMDDTDYLFSTEANKKHLLKAINHIENGGELVEVDLDKLKRQFLK